MSESYISNISKQNSSYFEDVEKSLIIPVYRNEDNIPLLIKTLNNISSRVKGVLEVIFVIDDLSDRSGDLLLRAREKMEFRSTIIFHSRNFGSLAAVRTGLMHISSDIIAVMAADLQEPPELILEFFDILENDKADVVFGKRIKRSDNWFSDFFSNFFWFLYRKLVIPEIPKGGADVFGCNKTVLDSLLKLDESNSSIIGQLFWVGFRHQFVEYIRQPRLHGKSKWKLSKKIRYLMDSVFSFSQLPILIVLYLGFLGSLVSGFFGLFILINKIYGQIVLPGYATIVVLITFSTSVILFVQGIIGSYLWRAFENTKKRPLSIISHISRSK